MEIQRTLWKNSFTSDQIPKWTCPTCGKGQLLKADAKNIKSFESANSLSYRNDDAWEPYWISGSFLGLLTCSNQDCKEKVTVNGKMHVEEDHEYDEQTENYYLVGHEHLTPQYFVPHLLIFNINKDVPDKIKDAINESFRLYWSDTSSCANKIRISVELIMDDMKIPKTALNKKNKRTILSLHHRIEKFRLTNPEEANYLMAIKWIGNAGSHTNEPLTKDDVLDGYEILDHVTTKLYELESSRIKKISKTINKTKKPRSKKKAVKKKV